MKKFFIFILLFLALILSIIYLFLINNRTKVVIEEKKAVDFSVEGLLPFDQWQAEQEQRLELLNNNEN